MKTRKNQLTASVLAFCIMMILGSGQLSAAPQKYDATLEGDILGIAIDMRYSHSNQRNHDRALETLEGDAVVTFDGQVAAFLDSLGFGPTLTGDIFLRVTTPADADPTDPIYVGFSFHWKDGKDDWFLQVGWQDFLEPLSDFRGIVTDGNFPEATIDFVELPFRVVQPKGRNAFDSGYIDGATFTIVTQKQ